VSSAISEDVIRGVAATILVFTAAMVTSAITYARDLTRNARRSRMLGDAKNRVDFWEAWARALPLVSCTNPQVQIRMKNDLIAAAIAIEVAFSEPKFPHGKLTPQTFEAYRKRHSRLQRALLLYEQPHSYGRQLVRNWRIHLLIDPIFVLALVALSLLHPPRHHLTIMGAGLEYALPFSLVIQVAVLLLLMRWRIRIREKRPYLYPSSHLDGGVE
jgi:hypothetical protein